MRVRVARLPPSSIIGYKRSPGEDKDPPVYAQNPQRDQVQMLKDFQMEISCK